MKGSLGLLPLPLVWTAALFFVLGGLGSFPILDNNEGLYAGIAREMLASPDWRGWVIPHLNGLPYMEKPPLLYWLTAMSFAVFGIGEFSARLVPALSTLACVAMILRFSTRFGHVAAGRFAALAFVSGMGVVVMSHVVMFDVLLTALLTAAVFNAWVFLREDGDAARHAWRWTCAALALAVLAKGLVAGVLFGLVFVGSALTSGRRFRDVLVTAFEPFALLIFCALVLPWHFAAAWVEPIFPWFYFVNEHLLRFMGRRAPHDYYGGPWWYYLPRMALYLFPWILLLPLRLASRMPIETDVQFSRWLALAWALPLLFFSVSTAKANYYLVTVMPFFALHLAMMVNGRDWRHSPVRLAPALGLVVVCSLLGWAVMKRPVSPSLPLIAGMQVGVYVGWVLFALAACGMLIAVLAIRNPRLAVTSLLLPAGMVAAALMTALPAFEDLASAKRLASRLASEPERKPFLYLDFAQKSSLAYYLRQPVTMVDSASADLFWGIRLKPGPLAVDHRQLMEEARRVPVALVVTDERLPHFREQPWSGAFAPADRIGNASVFVNAREPRSLAGGVSRTPGP